MKKPLTIGEYLIQQLHAHGVGHVFGIPGMETMRELFQRASEADRPAFISIGMNSLVR